MKNVIFIAPPAAGKGTVSELLVENYGYKQVTTSNLLKEVVNSNTPLGDKIKDIMAKGELVSDDLVIELIGNTLKNIYETNLFILDGSPRTMKQAEGITNIFKELHIENYIAIYLDIDKKTAMERALGRLICTKCGRGYNIYSDKFKPINENVCDDCHEELTKRSDDNEESFNKRFDIYLEKTTEVINYFRDINKLVTIDANCESNLVYEKVKKEINNG